MGTVQVDAATAELLRNAAAGTRVVGPDGRLLAAVLPPDLLPQVQRLIDERFDDEDDVTLEELKAADEAGGEIPHEEVMKRLGLE
jgi:hypothetical protein